MQVPRAARSSAARCLASAWLLACTPPASADPGPETHFKNVIQPMLEKHCVTCHSTEEQEGELDLERFTGIASVVAAPSVWQHVREQLELGEMPPKEKPRLSPEEKSALLHFVGETLASIALANAGDPGPVVLRRLSNAETTYTLRDLTGIASLNPTAEFPADSAAGEGFTNAGAALVMSPALLVKYLDAAKAVARHAVLLPDGIAFSEHTTPNDWAEERLTAIRSIYDRYSVTGGDTSLNLQGVRVDSQDGGIIPLERYLAALLDPAAATTAGPLSGRYLALLSDALSSNESLQPLASIRARWQTATLADVPALAAEIRRWQAASWRFTSVGHIGKRDGPLAWQEPVSPGADRHEVRLKLPASEASSGSPDVVSLIISDAGDGTAGDQVILENPRLVRDGRPPVPLADLPRIASGIATLKSLALPQTPAYLDALAVSHRSGQPLETLAAERNLDPQLLANWAALASLGTSASHPPVTPFAARLSNTGDLAPIRGWGFTETPSVIANASDEAISFSTLTVPKLAVAVHPSPTQAVIVDWRSPIAGTIQLHGLIADADDKGGNGVVWRVEKVTASGPSEIAAGVMENGGSQRFATDQPIAIESGGLIRIAIDPRDDNHGFDTTHLELVITETSGAGRSWDLGKEVSTRIHEGNPLADTAGHPAVWHFGAVGDAPVPSSRIPAGSLLALWRDAVSAGKAADATDLTRLLGDQSLPKSPADEELRDRLLAWDGPLDWYRIASSGLPEPGARLEASAPAILEFSLPPGFAAGAEIIATARLADPASEGSVQFHAISGKADEALARSIHPQVPIITNPESAARVRIEAGLDQFRHLFPAALCYKRIVPVDEVVTLTLYHREDEALSRLMLGEDESAALDQLWEELHFVSRTPLLLVDVFEQLWQYATQDADPSAFEPMREPVRRGAEAFTAALATAEPRHLEATLDFARRAWRRPLTDSEGESLRKLYHQLRTQELPHDEAIRLTLARILTAPAFLYKFERPGPGTLPSPVSDLELATRLSYFLWSSAPDDELLQVAASGKLRNPTTLIAQTERLLAGDRIRRLALEFGCQWLHIRDFDKLDEKSETRYPEFAAIREVLHEEPIRFFTDFFQSNRPVSALLDADYIFANESLAEYYGINEVHGAHWRRVEDVRKHGRGGLLGFGATLARHSGASRTSPILRGTWVVETLLGEHLPPPPRNVPTLPEEAPDGLSERELTEKHSSDPACSRCHARIDPYGFALEHYDAIGRIREFDIVGDPVNSSTQTADGTAITGIDGLRDYLAHERRDAFVRQFSRKLLGYALGRESILSDGPLLDEMVKQCATDDRVGTLVRMIVLSPQFLNIRGVDHPGNP